MRCKRRTPRRIRPWHLWVIAAAIVSEGLPVWLRAHRIGGNVVVRCRRGHLFTTIWVPGASLKAIRFGPWRVQRCPVGHHLAVVTPARESELSEDELRVAREHHDVFIP